MWILSVFSLYVERLVVTGLERTLEVLRQTTQTRVDLMFTQRVQQVALRLGLHPHQWLTVWCDSSPLRWDDP